MAKRLWKACSRAHGDRIQICGASAVSEIHELADGAPAATLPGWRRHPGTGIRDPGPKKW